jgi:hypothetical protein
MNQAWIPTVAGVFVLVVLFLAGILDIFLGSKFGQYATISFQVQTWCQRWPVLYLVLAWLLFHLTSVPCTRNVVNVMVEPGKSTEIDVP